MDEIWTETIRYIRIFTVGDFGRFLGVADRVFDLYCFSGNTVDGDY